MGVKWEIKRWSYEFDGPALWGADLRKGGVLVECNDFVTHAEALEYALSRIKDDDRAGRNLPTWP